MDPILTSITDALLKGEKVELRGFGSFQSSGKRNAKAGIRKRERP